MNETRYSKVYKRLAIAVIFSPAVFFYFWNKSKANADVSGMYELAASIMFLPSLVCLLFIILAIGALIKAKGQSTKS